MQKILLFISLVCAGDSYAVSLNDYLKQVENNSKDLQRIVETQKNLETLYKDAELAYSPQLIGAYSKLNDRTENASPFFQGDETRDELYRIGLMKKFSTGTEVTLSTTRETLEIRGTTPPQSEQQLHYNSLKIEQPLLRGLFANDLKAKIEELKAKSAQQSAELSSLHANLRKRAIVAYWNLALMRKVVELRKAALERTNSIVQWTNDRKKLGVSESADVFSAQASNLEAKTNLEIAEQQLSFAERNFNIVRGTSGKTSESLSVKWGFERAQIKKTSESSQVMVANKGIDLAKAQATQRRYALLPDLRLTYEYQRMGRDIDRSISWDESRSAKNDRWRFGITLTAPLDIFAINSIWKGSRSGIIASEFNLEKVKLEEDQTWQNLLTEKETLEARIQTSESILSARQKALTAEERRFRQSRSSLLNVVDSQSRFASSQEMYFNLLSNYRELLARADELNSVGF